MTPPVPNLGGVLLLGGLGAIGWTAIGWPLARRLLPRGIAAGAVAPLLGWCLQMLAAAVLLPGRPFGGGEIALVWAGCMLLAWAATFRQRSEARPRTPAWLALVAGVLAIAPAVAILPKSSAGGIVLSAPIFDHAKIALVDAIARSGLPPRDPFYGADAGGLTYYWWWHLSAAELARLAGASGWTADAALTWFTGAASVMLVGGLGAALAGRAGGVGAVALLLPGSLRWLVAPLERGGWLHEATGLGGWLNQASWAPQHLAAGGALVVSALLLAGMAETPTFLAAVVLGAVVAAGFGASTWVGGVTAAIVLPLVVGVLMVRMAGAARGRFLLLAGAAAAIALLATLPLLRTQLQAAGGRGGGLPMALMAYPVLGPRLGSGWADWLAAPILLLIEYPALVVLGAVGAADTFRRRVVGWHEAVLAVLAGSLLTSLWLRSTVDNNDLGWRSIVPALLLAAPLAAAAGVRGIRERKTWAMAAMALAVLGVPGLARLLHDNAAGRLGTGDPSFAASAPAWAALRRLSGPADRVASNPDLAAGMTPWPINIAWALLADRPSCYAGWATAHAFAPVPTIEMYATDQEVHRVFAGAPRAGDVADLALRLHCRFVLVLPGDPAWARDPFAASPLVYRVVSAGPGWRIYRATAH